MSDQSISIVPRLSSYPDRHQKEQEIIHWLASRDIIKPSLSNCVLGAVGGYAISEGARLVTNFPDQLPFKLTTNGLEVVTQRQIFDTGENGMDECICPNCKGNVALEDWGIFTAWHEGKSNKLDCPLCGESSEINLYKFSPEWGFSDLGFTFWNWPELSKDFIEAFQERLGCEISIVYARY